MANAARPERLPAPTKTPADAVVWLIAALTLAACLAIFWTAERDPRGPWMSADTGSFLNIGSRMLAGDVLYREWRATNPPGYHLVALVSAALAAAAGMPLVFTHYALLLAVATLGLAGLHASLRAAGEPAPVRIATAAAYCLVIVQAGYRTLDFGQREQLFALLLLPYLLDRTRSRIRPAPLRVAIFFLLGFCATFKPHFLALILGVELLARQGGAADRRGLRALAAGVIAVPIGLVLHSPAALHHFLSETLPFHLRGEYALYRSPAWRAMAAPGPALLVATSVLVLVLLRRDAPRLGRRFAIVWGGALLLSWATVLQQGRFWSYHFAVVWALCCVAGTMLAAARPEALLPRLRPVTVAAVALLALGAGVLDLASDVTGRRDPLAHRLVSVAGPGARALVVSQDIHGLCTPVPDQLRCLGPWPLHARLPALTHERDPSARRAALRAYAGDLRELIRRRRPALLAFSTSRAHLAGASPAELFAADDAVFDRAAYRPLSPAEVRRLGAHGWLLLVRRTRARVAGALR